MRGLMRRLFSGLQWRLLLLVLLACAPLVGLTLHTASEERRQLVKEWNQRAREIAQLAAREEGQAVGQTRQLLFNLAESAAVRSGNRRRCKIALDELVASYPCYANAGVIMTNGMVLASARPMLETGNQTNRPFFRRAFNTRAFAMGNLPNPYTSGRRTVNFGSPVFDQDGRVQAVAFVALDLDWLSRFDSGLPSRVPPGAAWVEVDRGGRILASHPPVEHGTSPYVPDKSELADLFSRKLGALERKSANGLGYHAFVTRRSQLVRDDVVTILSSPKPMVFADANRRLTASLTGLGIAAALAFMLGGLGGHFLVLRPVRSLVKSTRVAVDGSNPRVSALPRGDELGQITRAFDHMARVVQQHELECQHARQRLQTLSRRLVNVQEAERRHIALELHDEIGQALTVAEMNLQAALLAPGNGNQSRLKQSLDAVERVMGQVHDISLNLRPSMLDDLGLEPALRWLTKRQAELAGFQGEVRADALEQRLDSAIETECFRVAQEALTNVVRHAQAKNVEVELRQIDDQLHLRVRDDGVGFNVAALREQAARGTSLGLLSMEERANLAGGGMELRSTPGQGTEIHAWFPLRWRTASTEMEGS